MAPSLLMQMKSSSPSLLRSPQCTPNFTIRMQREKRIKSYRVLTSRKTTVLDVNFDWSAKFAVVVIREHEGAFAISSPDKLIQSSLTVSASLVNQLSIVDTRMDIVLFVSDTNLHELSHRH